MANAQIEQRFNAAVNVIRGLPKNGSYQPSNDMMLRFYAYFKQATLGPCTLKKPAFWDVVSRAKWDSYKALGKMPKERAMELYVEELKKIIETMSYTDNVAEFMGSISELEGINVDDLEAIAPEAIKIVKSRPNSPFASRESSPTRIPLLNGEQRNGNVYENGYTPTNTLNGIHNNHYVSTGSQSLSTPSKESIANHQNGYSTEHSDDEFIDTVEDDPHEITINHNSRSFNRRFDHNNVVDNNNNMGNNIGNNFERNNQQHLHHNNHIISNNNNNNMNPDMISSSVIQILRTVDQMNGDIQQIQNRICTIEKSLTEVKNHQLRKKVNININIQILNFTSKKRSKKSKIMQLRYPKWWPFTEISPNWFILMIIWPFVARRIMNMINRNRD